MSITAFDMRMFQTVASKLPDSTLTDFVDGLSTLRVFPGGGGDDLQLKWLCNDIISKRGSSARSVQMGRGRNTLLTVR